MSAADAGAASAHRVTGLQAGGIGIGRRSRDASWEGQKCGAAAAPASRPLPRALQVPRRCARTQDESGRLAFRLTVARREAGCVLELLSREHARRAVLSTARSLPGEARRRAARWPGGSPYKGGRSPPDTFSPPAGLTPKPSLPCATADQRPKQQPRWATLGQGLRRLQGTRPSEPVPPQPQRVGRCLALCRCRGAAHEFRTSLAVWQT